jgi:hypothetical protein
VIRILRKSRGEFAAEPIVDAERTQTSIAERDVQKRLRWRIVRVHGVGRIDLQPAEP